MPASPATYQHKGHRFVDVDVQVLANERIPVARIAHTAIWLPRQLAAAWTTRQPLLVASWG